MCLRLVGVVVDMCLCWTAAEQLCCTGRRPRATCMSQARLQRLLSHTPAIAVASAGASEESRSCTLVLAHAAVSSIFVPCCVRLYGACSLLPHLHDRSGIKAGWHDYTGVKASRVDGLAPRWARHPLSSTKCGCTAVPPAPGVL